MSQMMIPKWRWAAAVAIAGSALVNVSLILSRQEPIFSRSAVVMIVAYLLPYYLLVRLAVRKPRCGRDAVVRLAGSVSLAVVGILLTRVASSLGIVLLLIGGAVVVEVVARMASHSREGMVWLGWGALSLVVSFFINWAIAPYVHLPKAESYYGAEMPADVRGQLDHFYWIWDSPERVREEQTRMRDQNPEWDLISRAFLGYSLANVALQYPAEREKALEVLDRVIDDTVVVPWRKFLLPYGNERAFVRQPASSIMVDGEVSLMIGLRRLVEDPDDYAHRDVYREQIERCVAAIEDGPLLCAESYPDECWLWCTPLALCSIKIYDLLEGTDHSDLFKRWEAVARKSLVDPKYGLINSAVTLTGGVIHKPEGSTIWIGAYCLMPVAPAFAKEQYETMKAAMISPVLFLRYGREWPKGERGEWDIDSGFTPFGMGPASTGFALVTSKAMDDRDLFVRLLKLLELVGVPREEDGRVRYLSSNLVGDATFLLAKTTGPAWAEIERREREGVAR